MAPTRTRKAPTTPPKDKTEQTPKPEPDPAEALLKGALKRINEAKLPVPPAGSTLRVRREDVTGSPRQDRETGDVIVTTTGGHKVRVGKGKELEVEILVGPGLEPPLSQLEVE